MVVIMLLVGWIVVAPALVVCGLYIAAGKLGARTRRTGSDITWLARELADLWVEPAPSASVSPAPVAGSQPVAH